MTQQTYCKTRAYSSFVFCITVVVFISTALPVCIQAAEKTVIPLNTGWKFRQTGTERLYDAVVPGCIHTDLLANKLIDDPFALDNESKLQWIGKTDWEYHLMFTADEALLKRNNIFLVFKGLDTYADVFLNGNRIITADNMFREWRADCKALLKTGANEVRIVFYSPINKILPMMKTIPYELPASNDQGEKTSPYTRKAPYHFGWDWGPRYVTAGIWQAVCLEAWDDAAITDVLIRTKTASSDNADIIAAVEIQSVISTRAIIRIKDTRNAFSSIVLPVELEPGINTFTAPIIISKPKLWWPNGLGEQPLYTIVTSVELNGKTADRYSQNIGIRTIELRQTPDIGGKSFTFVVNGVPVFAKGGNWIPADSFVPRVKPERYRHLLTSCKDANMNMLRVWGGGIYEDDLFYDLCDEMGIMVWQDFMFSCSMYPGDEAFLSNVKQEAVYQVKRLRNHPSIVLWCGNNECEIAWFTWGWRRQLPASVWEDYRKLFHELLPAVVTEYDPQQAYRPSSPSANLEVQANSQNIGDVHYWDVWHGQKPFSEYTKQFPSFNSEYGFQSLPSLKTIEYFARPEDMKLESPIMNAHQKNPRGNFLIMDYLRRDYFVPKDFPSLVYVSQVLQAEGIKIGAEHLRRIMPRCMGSLYWQVNDCWPVASWSSIDYFGRWKALQYYARRFYNDILVSPTVQNDTIKVFVISDRLKQENAILTIQYIDFSDKKKPVLPLTKTISINPQSSTVFYNIQKEEWARFIDPASVYLYCKLTQRNAVISENRLFFNTMKDCRLPVPNLKIYAKDNANGFEITVSTDELARNVYLSTNQYDGFFTDNFFDLNPGQSMTIQFKTAEKITLEEFRKTLTVQSLVDAFGEYKRK